MDHVAKGTQADDENLFHALCRVRFANPASLTAGIRH
jgi:hypothetical protein